MNWDDIALYYGTIREEWQYFSGAVVTIFFIIDPFGVVPIYLSLGQRFSPADLKHIRIKATMLATGILMLFALTGTAFFRLFGISLPAFQIGGGLLLLIFAIHQLSDKRERVADEEADEGLERDDISLFPLATPLLAGPASISTVILYATEAVSTTRRLELAGATIVAMFASFLVLAAAPALMRILGRTGLNILTRIMGLVLTAIAIQFILNGVKEAAFEITKSLMSR